MVCKYCLRMNNFYCNLWHMNVHPDEVCKGFMHRDHWYKSGYRWYKKPDIANIKYHLTTKYHPNVR